MSRNITICAFVKKRDIGISTFESWLAKLKKAGQHYYKKDKMINNKQSFITTLMVLELKKLQLVGHFIEENKK